MVKQIFKNKTDSRWSMVKITDFFGEKIRFFSRVPFEFY